MMIQSQQIVNLSSRQWDETPTLGINRQKPSWSSVPAILGWVLKHISEKALSCRGLWKTLKTPKRNMQEMWNTMERLNLLMMAIDEGEDFQVNGTDHISADNVTSKNQRPSNKTRLKKPYFGQLVGMCKRLPKYGRLLLLSFIDLQRWKVNPVAKNTKCFRHRA